MLLGFPLRGHAGVSGGWFLANKLPLASRDSLSADE